MTDAIVKDVHASVPTLGIPVEILYAGNSDRDIEAAFANLSQKSGAALLVTVDVFFFTRRALIVTLANAQRTRHAFSKAFVTALARDFEAHGEEVFKRVRRESPASYLKVCAMLVPRELQVEHSGGVKAMTDEQIEQSIEIIKAMLAEREAGANAKVIEGEAELIPSLPAPASGGTKPPKS
jgi:hypothetical protein